MNCVIPVIFVFVTPALLCTNNRRIDFQKPHIAALVLARGGSKGIPLKNLAKIRGRSLLNNTLTIILPIIEFSSVWVSTDHPAILSEAGPANVHWRSPESATDAAASILGVQDFIHSHPEVDIVALIQCTSPFIKQEYLREAVKLILETEVDCVFAVTSCDGWHIQMVQYVQQISTQVADPEGKTGMVNL